MENLSISAKRKAKLEQEANAAPIVVNPVSVDATTLIIKCDALIAEAQELYVSNSNKELSDAIIILHSAKRSLHKISLN